MSTTPTMMQTIVLRSTASRPRWRALLDRVKTIVTIWVDRERSRRMLANFDGRLLREIGMTEADRRYECAKPFWRE